MIFDKLFSFFKSSKTAVQDFPGIVAAKVTAVNKHPNADRLRLISLDIGGKIVEPVVCGAWNFKENDVVALALPGAKITQNIHSETHESFVLEKAKIRGTESQGMICAAFELGLTNEPGKGIMILKPETVLGNTFNSNMIQVI